MARTAGSYALLALLLALLAGVAWLTRHPEAEILQRATGWPLVGPLAGRFRDAYLPPAAAAPAMEETAKRGPAGRRPPPAPAVVVVHEVDPDLVGARPWVWVQAGTAIHEHPDAASRVLRTEAAIVNLAELERRGDWFRVRRATPTGEPIVGWVHLPGYEEPTPARLATPEPVLPLPARPPEPERLAAARALLDPLGEHRVGPWTLHTDVVEPGLLALLDGVARGLEPLYRERYGVAPVGGAAEAVFLFRSREAFSAFRAGEAALPPRHHGYAAPARGYVALESGERRPDELASTLVHELVHLLNRRAIGPALPGWLDEGIADDLAESRLDAAGRLVPGLTSDRVERQGEKLVRHGGAVSALLLQRAYEEGLAPPLPALLAMGPEEFLTDGRLHYAQSSSWVRFLLSGRQQGLAEGFRRFLAAVAAGAEASPEALRRELGVGWPELEGAFRGWVRTQAVPRADEVLLAEDAG